MTSALLLLTLLSATDGGVEGPPSPLTVYGALELAAATLPSGLPENGLDGFATLHPVAGLAVGDGFGLELGPTLRLRVVDAPGANRAGDAGGVLRGADWDEPSDFGQLLQALRLGSEASPVTLRLGPVRKKTLGAGHLVHRASGRANADYHPAAGTLAARLGPVRGELFASDLLGLRLFAGEVAWDVGETFSPRPTQHGRWVLAAQLAHDAGRAGRPFGGAGPAPGAATLAHLDASAVLVQGGPVRWAVLAGAGARVGARLEGGFVGGTAVDLSLGRVGVSTRLEVRTQGGGFRQGFFGPGLELQRFADVGFSGAGLAEAALPQGFSGAGEVRVGVGRAVSVDVAAEYFAWGRLDLDAGAELSLLGDWLAATARFTALGVGLRPRYSGEAGLRWRLLPSLYALAQAGTAFMPQPDGTLLRGVTASVGVGVDLEG